jgi:hypothetical protein
MQLEAKFVPHEHCVMFHEREHKHPVSYASDTASGDEVCLEDGEACIRVRCLLHAIISVTWAEENEEWKGEHNAMKNVRITAQVVCHEAFTGEGSDFSLCDNALHVSFAYCDVSTQCQATDQWILILTTEEAFFMWSSQCSVLGNGPIATHFDAWHVFSVRSNPSLYKRVEFRS